MCTASPQCFNLNIGGDIGDGYKLTALLREQAYVQTH